MSLNQFLIEEDSYSYLETGGDKPVLLLLHGLFGALSNFEGLVLHFREKYNVVVPILPIFKISVRKLNLGSLVDFVAEFVAYKSFDSFHLIGNSLGGHLAQLYQLRKPEQVISITLTGSSGLFENSMGSTFPKRGNYEYVKKKAGETFYDPAVATKELVDEVFDTVNNRMKTLAVIATARSAIKNNLEDKLPTIKCPVLLIWGNNDIITPPFVAEKFHSLLPNSTLKFIDKCGHAPMMEHPKLFNEYLADFLNNI